MRNTKLVTAFYTEIHNHPFYGHQEQSRHERYLHSMRVLNNMGIEIVCYCNDTQLELLTNYIDEFELNNIKLKVSNLSDSPFASRMKDIKENTNNFKFYHEVDWNKLYLLEKEYDESYDYLYWIDVGLSHHGIFPKKYNPNSHLSTGMSSDFNTYSFTNLFTQNLFKGINNFVGERLLSLDNELKFHNVYELNEVLEGNFTFDSLSVGGILGGHISKVKWLIDRFNLMGEKSLNKNIILNHEAIISFIKEETPENFKRFFFQTWYHEDTEGMDDYIIKEQIHFSHFFDMINEKYITNI
jgi:hypothetical protein